MTRYASDVAFTPAVKSEQEKRGSRASYARMQAKTDWESRITDDLARFLAGRDSFYLATASADGQPYVQHRGGPKGFLKVIDATTLGFADFAGNRQYISTGNLAENDRAHIFAMDYPNRRRIKLWGRIRVVEDDPGLLARLAVAGYDGRPERAVLFEVAAWDVNCPQHITPRYTLDELEPVIGALRARIAELESRLAGYEGQAGTTQLSAEEATPTR